MSRQIGGIIFIKVDGQTLTAKGEFTYNTGKPKRQMVIGRDRVHGYTEMPQIPYIEGTTTDHRDVDTEAIKNIVNATVTLELNNGKTFVLREAAYTSEGNMKTEEGEMDVRFEGTSGDVIQPGA